MSSRGRWGSWGVVGLGGKVAAVMNEWITHVEIVASGSMFGWKGV